jgi:hypothetical protein
MITAVLLYMAVSVSIFMDDSIGQETPLDKLVIVTSAPGFVLGVILAAPLLIGRAWWDWNRSNDYAH